MQLGIERVIWGTLWSFREEKVIPREIMTSHKTYTLSFIQFLTLYGITFWTRSLSFLIILFSEPHVYNIKYGTFGSFFSDVFLVSVVKRTKQWLLS